MVLFFFSSRRRHTRCGRDWSSDVCSSDLDGSSLRVTAVTQSLPKGIEAGVRVRRAAGTEKPDAEYLGRLLRVARGKDAETAEEQGDSENKSRCGHGLPSWLGSVTRQHTACSSAEVADGPGPLGLCP